MTAPAPHAGTSLSLARDTTDKSGAALRSARGLPSGDETLGASAGPVTCGAKQALAVDGLAAADGNAAPARTGGPRHFSAERSLQETETHLAHSPVRPAVQLSQAESSSTGRVLRLSQLEPGQTGRVVRVHGHGPQGLRQRLLDMGVTRGAEVRVLRRAPLGDPVEFAVCGFCLALRLSEADVVELEPAKPMP